MGDKEAKLAAVHNRKKEKVRVGHHCPQQASQSTKTLFHTCCKKTSGTQNRSLYATAVFIH
jgi:hypothetical protein